MKRLSILAILLAALLAVGGAIVASVGSAFSVAFDGAKNVSWTQARGTLVDRQFDLADATHVVVYARDLDIRIAAGTSPSGGLHVRGRVPANLASRITFARSGATATLTLVPNAYVPARSWSYSIFDDTKPVVVTLESSRRIDVVSTSGDVGIDDWRAPFAVETTSGDVRLARSRSAGTIRTTSGDVHAIDVADALDVRTTSGDVDATFAAIPADVAIATASGDVEVRVPASVRAALAASTSSGDLENGASLPATLAGAPVVRVTTASGDITTRR